MNEQTVERRAALRDLLTCASVNCPNTPAYTDAQILFESLRGSTDKTPDEHAQIMSLVASCIAQIQNGATMLDLNARAPQPTLASVRRDLERSLPRGPNRG